MYITGAFTYHVVSRCTSTLYDQHCGIQWVSWHTFSLSWTVGSGLPLPAAEPGTTFDVDVAPVPFTAVYPRGELFPVSLFDCDVTDFVVVSVLCHVWADVFVVVVCSFLFLDFQAGSVWSLLLFFFDRTSLAVVVLLLVITGIENVHELLFVATESNVLGDVRRGDVTLCDVPAERGELRGELAGLLFLLLAAFFWSKSKDETVAMFIIGL